MNGAALSPVRFLAASSLAMALAGCTAGVGDLIEPAALIDRHPFPTRAASDGHELHEVRGIDVSKYQGEIDWSAVKAAGIGFAFIKATEGTDRVDERFQINWAGAKAAGVARGAYHFSYWCTPMARQFENFRRTVPADADAMPPVLDLEWNHQSPTCPRKIPKEQALAEIRVWLRLAEQHYGKKPIIYVEIPFYRDVLSGGELAEYPMWLRSVAAPPQARYPDRRWAFWQYTDRGRVNGIASPVDKNVFAGTREEWRRLVASNFSGPAPRPGGAAPAVRPAPQPPTLVASGSTTGGEMSGGKMNRPGAIPLPPIRQASR